jgi:hypothetical protein
MGQDEAYGRLIGTVEAARLLNVSRQAVSGWFKSRRVEDAHLVEGDWKASERAVRKAKVLAASKLLEFGVTERKLADFERRQGALSKASRFSLDDISVICGQIPPGAIGSTRVLPALDRLRLHIDLRVRGVDPHDFPDEAWPLHVCPPFVSPPNLFAYGLGQYIPDDARPMAVRITRSAGLLVTAEGAKFVAATRAYDVIFRPLRELPSDLALDTQVWHGEVAAWENAWRASIERRRGDK